MISANYVTVEYDGIVYVTLGGNCNYEIEEDIDIVDVWELPRNNCGQFMEVTV
jgi:hypothetical protein